MEETVTITSLDHYGRGISSIYNKIVFIENTLPKEEVTIKVINNKKNYCEAIPTNYIKTSNKRIIPKCIYYNECGGCNIMHMDYITQLQFKENKVKEILKKFADIDSKLIKEIVSTNQFNYRNKITLQINKELGLYKKISHEIVNINKCLISNDNINKVINKLNTMDLININQIIIRESDCFNEVMIILCIKGKINERYFVQQLNSICSSIIKKDKKEYKTLYGKEYLTDKIGNYLFKISPDSFFQVNNIGTYKLYELIKKYANLNKQQKVLDLYCGTGTIGIYLSDSCKNVIGIEINKYAIQNALENKKLNNITNIDFICNDVSNIIDKYQNIDVIILDPPRSGLNDKTIESIIKINPQKIIYVSCDPVTLARDMNQLKEKYNIEEITLVDMFPNTYHVECIAFLSQKDIKL